MPKPMAIPTPHKILQHMVTITLPDKTRQKLRGRSFMDCMRRAEKAGAVTVIDGACHKWEQAEGGGFNSVGVVAKRIQ